MTMLCNGMVTLDGSQSQSGPNISYSWSALPGNVLAYGNTIHPVVNALGIYTITVTNTTTGCFSTDTTSVIGSMPPIASFTTTPDPAVGYVPLNVTFNNTSLNGSTYQWILGDGTTATTYNTSDFYLHAGTYTVYLIVTNSLGCVDTAETVVTVHDTYSIIFPNIFTPNDDGNNDTYTPIVTGVVELHAEIFDRWGLKLYEWNTVNGGWDGYTTSGQRCAQGTYFYIVHTVGVQGEDHTDQGSFMLIKN
jgi:gliding motility-associated-like protein